MDMPSTFRGDKNEFCFVVTLFRNKEKFAVVVPVTSVELTCAEAILARSFSTLLVMCLMTILGRSAQEIMAGNI